jgi:hypothetical protein
LIARAAILGAVLLLGSCASVGEGDDPEDVAALLKGRWDNAAQYAAAPAALKKPPKVGELWLDRQFATFAEVKAPKIGKHVVYLEWRSGGPTGPISRQRIWSFRPGTGGAVLMDFFAFKAPQRFAGKAGDKKLFKAMTLADLTVYPDDCAARFEKRGDAWIGRIDPRLCEITATGSGRAMAIETDIVIVPGRLFRYKEAGILADGREAFRVPPERPYEFVPVK